MASNPGDVLIVDDPDEGERLAARLREDLDGPEVLTVHTRPEARALLRRRRVDCVVSDLDVPDGDGVEFLGGIRLLRSIREEHADLPFILYTGVGNQDVAEEATAADVTDYIPRWREYGSYDRLVSRIESAIARRQADRRAARQARINEVIRDVNRTLVRASSRREIERSVPERFAASDQYRMAWCGRTDDDGTVDVTAWAGLEDPPDGPLTVPDEGTAAGPVYRALATGEVRAVHRAVEDPEFERWREEARRWGYGSMAAVPFVYEGTTYGVLAVYAGGPAAFDETERAVLSELGRTIGHAVDAVLARREIERRERELQAQNDRLEEFVDVVSHDLRNPLAVAKGHADLLDDAVDHGRVAEIRDALDRMDRLVEDLLALARQGRSLGDRQDVSLGRVAEGAWESVATDEASLAFEDELRTVHADETRLRQALENLFRNAVEHGSTNPDSQGRQDAVEHGPTGPDSRGRRDAGGATTSEPSVADAPEDAVEHGSSDPHPTPREYAVEHGDDTGDGLTVRVGRLSDRAGFYVEDDGRGIPPGERDRVLETGYSTKDDGTGLGLGIVRDVVEAHGWSLVVTESAAGGARFEIVTE